MQDTQPFLQTQHVFGTRRWHRLPPDQWHTLRFPDHLTDQVLRVLIGDTPCFQIVEFQVAEQFPKDAFDYLARGVLALGISKAIINVLHCRNVNAHLIFWDRANLNKFFHLDLDFANLSDFDQHLLALIQLPTPNHWTEITRLLAGQTLGKTFFKTLKRHFEKIPCENEAAYHGLVDLVLKLLFLVFVQRKGWLNFDPYYLESKMEVCKTRGLSILHCFLRPLFAQLEGNRVREWLPLGTLPRLGGGLFHFQPEVLPAIPNDWLVDLYRSLVSQYSFSLFENRGSREVVGISPEILGHVFENLLRHPSRKKLGTYYTPMRLALRQVDMGLETYLRTNGIRQDQPGFRKRLLAIKVLDPSCGSGTYLVAAFQALLQRHLAAAPSKERYNGKLFALKRKIVTQNLFGLDIHPMAIRLAEVRLWLNMIQDLEVSDPAKAPPLPSLQHHLRAGDFLGQYHPVSSARQRKWPKHDMLLQLRAKFPYAAAGKRLALLRHIERLEGELFEFLGAEAEAERWAKVRTVLAQITLPGHEPPNPKSMVKPGRKSTNPGQIHVVFSQAMLEGGFDLIVGNPPWLSASKMAKGHRNQILELLDKPTQLKLTGQVDLSIYFLVAASALLKSKGHLGFLMPGKMLQASFAKGLRQYLVQRMRLDYLLDLGIDQAMVFQADTFPLGLGLSNLEAGEAHKVRVETDSKKGSKTFELPQTALDNRWGTWNLQVSEVNDLAAGMNHWPTLGELGIKVRRGQVTHAKKFFVFNESPGFIPDSRLRPLLRGRDIQFGEVAPGALIYWPFEIEPLQWDCLTGREQRWLRRCPRVKDLGTRFSLPYRDRTHRAWLLIWKYLAKSWTVALCRAEDWVPDQTTYYVEFDAFEDAYRMFAFFYWPGVNELLQSLAERGKDRCFFYYAHTVSSLPIPPNLDRLPLIIPPPAACLRPQDGEAIWQGTAGRVRMETWQRVFRDLVLQAREKQSPGSLFSQAS